ncbi:MAG: hydroxyethylthiazole kinase [Candidatus Omnitrophica bacterium]|nr:hydroxyethylthiazole kinase [Candidatus Omnitrophota bacterium]MBU1869684.1 hydroxyethylthiazole kinase [Candidatus Omnitrophota bacterium]
MAKEKIEIYALLQRIRKEKPLVHFLTNWVTIYDCANIAKVLGASPVMAHAKEEAEEMAGLASALVLNIGTLTIDFVESMKAASRGANNKGIPVILDVCGAGSTHLRDKACFELLSNAKINVIKGNVSEIARIAGRQIHTKGVDSAVVTESHLELAKELAGKYKAVVVITGEQDIVSDGHKIYLVNNGVAMMGNVVGTGCLAASCIGAFCAVEKDWAYASAAGLSCFEIAAECAAKEVSGPGMFKEKIYDEVYNLSEEKINSMQKVELV